VLDLPLTIMNGDDRVHTFVVSAVRPSNQGLRCPPGYSDIPDTKWLSFSEREVEAPAQGHVAVKMILDVPAGVEFANQHWSVAIAVRSKPERGKMLSLGFYPRLEIETEAAPVEPPKGPPRGDLVVTPCTETVSDIVPGAAPKAIRLRVWNPTNRPWTGTVTVLTGKAAKEKRLDLSGSWRGLPDAAWVRPAERTLRVAAKQSTELPLRIRVPDAPDNFGGRWEAILLLEGDDGADAIARIRLRTAVQKKAD
jgi:hypothetical protein